jgi:opacity protein-like surface antigen
MFGSIKKAMVAGAVVATAALAGPAMASAAFPTWSPAGPAEGAGTLSITLPSGANTECDVAFTVDLVNNGTAHGGQVTSFTLSNCQTNAPGCTVTATASSLPWTIRKVTSNPNRVGIDGIVFANTYSGTNCALNGVVLGASGNVTGDYDGSTGELSFTNESGLTTALGAATLNGAVEILNESTGLPVGLS